MNLKNKELLKLLNTLNLPVAYHFFRKETPLPNLIFYQKGLKTFEADNKVYSKEYNYTIELYTETKDFELEEKLEKLLDDNDIIYTKSEDIRFEEEDFNLIYYNI